MAARAPRPRGRTAGVGTLSDGSSALFPLVRLNGTPHLPRSPHDRPETEPARRAALHRRPAAQRSKIRIAPALPEAAPIALGALMAYRFDGENRCGRRREQARPSPARTTQRASCALCLRERLRRVSRERLQLHPLRLGVGGRNCRSAAGISRIACAARGLTSTGSAGSLRRASSASSASCASATYA